MSPEWFPEILFQKGKGEAKPPPSLFNVITEI